MSATFVFMGPPRELKPTRDRCRLGQASAVRTRGGHHEGHQHGVTRRLRFALAGGVFGLTLAGSPAQANTAGYAIQLDGIHGYLGRDLPDGDLREGNTIALSAWILRASPNGDLISPEPRATPPSDWDFTSGSPRKSVRVEGNGSGTYVALVGTTSMPVGSWHHVAGEHRRRDDARPISTACWMASLDDGSIIQWDDLPPVFPPTQANWPSPAQLHLGGQVERSGDGSRRFPTSTSSMGSSMKLRFGTVRCRRPRSISTEG